MFASPEAQRKNTNTTVAFDNELYAGTSKANISRFPFYRTKYILRINRARAVATHAVFSLGLEHFKIDYDLVKILHRPIYMVCSPTFTYFTCLFRASILQCRLGSNRDLM